MTTSDITSTAIEIPLARSSLITLVSADDVDLLAFNWREKTDVTYHQPQHVVYRPEKINGKRKTVYIHRVILARVLSRNLEKDEIVDHINGNPLDNRRENLRLANRSQNNHNQGVNRKNTSGYKGVTFNKQAKLWIARIVLHKKAHYLGCFLTREDAAIAYNHAAKELHGEFARFNAIPGWENIHPKRTPGRWGRK